MPSLKDRTDDVADIQCSLVCDDSQAAGRADTEAVPQLGRARGGPRLLAGICLPYQGAVRLGRTLEEFFGRVKGYGVPVVFSGFKPAQDVIAVYKPRPAWWSS